MAMSLGDLGKKVTQFGQDALKKTQQLADVTGLKIKLEEEKKVTNNLYQQLGALYYLQCQDSNHTEELELLCDKVAESLARAEELTVQMKELQGGKRCPQCGETLSADAGFCTNCGTRLEAPQAVASFYCPNCGAAASEGSKFCNECGSKLQN